MLMEECILVDKFFKLSINKNNLKEQNVRRYFK